MTADHDPRLYLLSFDHRGSFEKGLMGIAGTPTEMERERIRALKALIYAGFEQAIAGGAPKQACGVLVDEEFGTAVARSAQTSRFTLAMPVERSGQDEFDFEFGEDFAQHIDAFDPDYAKVLVRYNPDGDQTLNRRQAQRLARLSQWVRAHDRKFLFELLVPATAAQLDQVAVDHDAYDRDMRPVLVVRTIAELQAAGVEPHIWKIEGLEARKDCERVVAQAQTGGREDVRCVVLGRGVDLARATRWLQVAAGVPGYIGLAIGRTIWLQALTDHLAGRIKYDEAVAVIAANYRQMIDVYDDAATAAPAPPAPGAKAGRR